MQTFGRHLLMEYQGCDREILDNPEQLEQLMRSAAEAAQATVVAAVFHSFTPCGTSGVLVLQESHLSIHTWPEVGYAAMDFYTCGECDPFAGHLVMCEGLRPEIHEIMDVDRGNIDRPHSLDITDHRIEGRRPRPFAAGGQR
ncbi:adenosylmethionine decarboxylase [Persicimonas caeni]|uniref:S-adenosylmethionine decarboxylase proenzyme n=1 Tax=Persicimonas caeni TaxID=2292766 RepID=A0A4Y6PZ20_PERCE|nr:adenosylmethionine decarboxylase [Persicimonas caeni]QDG53571.1 adenosylmethionine decarboxylase [Persicimonas caeni]QED34792.1 adenosylmethionine decarboxylase [Persicimonas caeni]